MAKKKNKKPKTRSFDAMNALMRRAPVFKDRRTPRKQSKNWKLDLPTKED